MAGFELDLELLERAAVHVPRYADVTSFPPVRRDLAFVVRDDAPAGDVHRLLRDAGRPLLDRSTLFDVYVGERIPPGTKSLAFSLEFRAPDRTLTDEEAQEAVDGIVARLASELGAQLRTG
jgi:phenylalanyl-tRNA synthetase beta chain